MPDPRFELGSFNDEMAGELLMEAIHQGAGSYRLSGLASEMLITFTGHMLKALATPEWTDGMAQRPEQLEAVREFFKVIYLGLTKDFELKDVKWGQDLNDELKAALEAKYGLKFDLKTGWPVGSQGPY